MIYKVRSGNYIVFLILVLLLFGAEVKAQYIPRVPTIPRFQVPTTPLSQRNSPNYRNSRTENQQYKESSYDQRYASGQGGYELGQKYGAGQGYTRTGYSGQRSVALRELGVEQENVSGQKSSRTSRRSRSNQRTKSGVNPKAGADLDPGADPMSGAEPMAAADSMPGTKFKAGANSDPLPGVDPTKSPMSANASKKTIKADSEESEEPLLSFAEQYDAAGPDTVITLNQKNFLSDDRVFMIANFMKGKANEETIPVILVHDMGESKKEMMPLAESLVKMGMAVLIPDLRGCGDCTKRIVSDFAYGQKPVDRLDDLYTIDKFVREDYGGMINYDGKFWFHFLIDQHNRKHLNMRKLVIIGSGTGAAVAAGWVKNDWSVGGSKNAHFTKLLVLISPEYKNCNRFLQTIKKRMNDQLGFLAFVGSLDVDRLEDVKKLQTLIAGRQPADTALEKRKFPFMPLKTSDQATKLLSDSFDLSENFKKFLNLRYARPVMKNTKWTEIRFDD